MRHPVRFLRAAPAVLFAAALATAPAAAQLTGSLSAVSLCDSARGQARSGHKDEALALLQQAVELGFYDVEALRTTDDFAGLRQDPRWNALTGHAEANLQLKKSLWDDSAFRTPYKPELS